MFTASKEEGKQAGLHFLGGKPSIGGSFMPETLVLIHTINKILTAMRLEGYPTLRLAQAGTLVLLRYRNLVRTPI
jgi:hypothetical protein